MANIRNQELSAGTVLRGREYTYVIEKVLGQGSFGITYLASTSMKGPLGRVTVSVALKEFFAQELDSRLSDGTVSTRTEGGVADKYARAFKRESENLSKMQHPGIVNVLESFEAKGTYYYSMEYLSGGSLDDKVKGNGITEDEALPITRKIGEAVSYMHKKMFMHLDLKPKNIMLKGDGTPVLIDFGLSKQYGEDGEPESSSTIGLGTPGYAPIEQATQSSGRVFQPTLDVYALGATLYKMLTGITPPTASEIFNDGFPNRPLLQKSVSRQTIDAICAAMSPGKKDRPQSVGHFMSLLPGITSPEDDTLLEPEPPPMPCVYGPPIIDVEGNNKPKEKSSKTWRWFWLASVAVVTILLAIVLSVSPYSGYENGHEWVDLGLPSGTKWAICNVGASSPTGNGNYYAWGETRTKKEYSLENYCFRKGQDSFSKYNTDSDYGTVDNKKQLDMSDDAARANWGGKWRIPTKSQWEELKDNCTWSWTGSGYKVTGPNGQSINLPAAGHWSGSSIHDLGTRGSYWSSSLSTVGYPGYACGMDIFSNSYDVWCYCARPCGYSVRPVTE